MCIRIILFSWLWFLCIYLIVRGCPDFVDFIWIASTKNPFFGVQLGVVLIAEHKEVVWERQLAEVEQRAPLQGGLVECHRLVATFAVRHDEHARVLQQTQITLPNLLHTRLFLWTLNVLHLEIKQVAYIIIIWVF